jgi:hypothetical protein
MKTLFLLLACLLSSHSWAQSGSNTDSGPSTELVASYANGKIFLVKSEAVAIQRYLALFPGEKILDAVDYLRKRMAVAHHASNGDMHTVIYVVSGDVNAGSKAKTKIHMQMNYGGPPEVFEYQLNGPSSSTNPVVILNETHVLTRGGGVVDCRLLLDDKEISRARFDVR